MFWSEKLQIFKAVSKTSRYIYFVWCYETKYTNAKILLLIDVFGGIVRRKYFYYCAQGALKKES